MFVIEHQLTLLVLFFLAGCVGTGFLLCHRSGHRAWLVADLVWVVLGGFGALGAVLAGVYTADSSTINRQIDLAYAASTAFDRDAARFRLSYCEEAQEVQVTVLCDKADYLAASTAENADLPLFIAVTQEVSPLQGLNILGSGDDAEDMSSKVETAEALDPGEFLVFDARDESTDAALEALRQTRPRVVADFVVLASSYEALVAQVTKLHEEWDILQSSAYILIIQIISIAMVSFAAPFRLGKSLVDIRDR